MCPTGMQPFHLKLISCSSQSDWKEGIKRWQLGAGFNYFQFKSVLFAAWNCSLLSVWSADEHLSMTSCELEAGKQVRTYSFTPSVVLMLTATWTETLTLLVYVPPYVVEWPSTFPTLSVDVSLFQWIATCLKVGKQASVWGQSQIHLECQHLATCSPLPSNELQE